MGFVKIYCNKSKCFRDKNRTETETYMPLIVRGFEI